MTLVVREIGSFYVGGRTFTLAGLPAVEIPTSADTQPIVARQSGEFEAFQLYAQYVRLAAPVNGALLLWHGGGLTGSTWERTPDDRPGWQTFFLEAGFDVYVSDAVERGRSSWARHPEIYASPPVFRSKQDAWELFRIGVDYASGRNAYDGSQFPVESFDAFTKSFVARWVTNDEPALAAYDALIRRVGPCTIVAHSQGAAFALQAALRAPDLVRAVVAVEPSGVPVASDRELAVLRRVPHLLVWGDYVERHPLWRTAAAAARQYGGRLRACGATCETIALPACGLRGNSHMPMLDRNSGEVAELVRRWLEQRLPRTASAT